MAHFTVEGEGGDLVNVKSERSIPHGNDSSEDAMGYRRKSLFSVLLYRDRYQYAASG